VARAIENQMYIVACNRIGSDGGNDFPGHSMIIDPWGSIISELANGAEGVLEGEIDIGKVDEIRRSIPVFDDRRPSVYELS
jgi:predicted amidohydrolase